MLLDNRFLLFIVGFLKLFLCMVTMLLRVCPDITIMIIMMIIMITVMIITRQLYTISLCEKP